MFHVADNFRYILIMFLRLKVQKYFFSDELPTIYQNK